MRILNSCVAGLPIWLFWSQILKFWLFGTPLAFLQIKKSQKIWLGSGKTLSVLHIHYKSLSTRVCYHAGCTEYCKNFTSALKMIDVIDEEQMHGSVITGKEYASKDWTCVISMFLTSLNVCFVCGCACFMCICLKTDIWLFLAFMGQGLALLVKTGWQPCCVV